MAVQTGLLASRGCQGNGHSGHHHGAGDGPNPPFLVQIRIPGRSGSDRFDGGQIAGGLLFLSLLALFFLSGLPGLLGLGDGQDLGREILEGGQLGLDEVFLAGLDVDLGL